MSLWTFLQVHRCMVPLWRCFYCLIHCCCCWVGCQWLFVHCRCCLWLNLFFRVLRAHGGKLQAFSAFLMCSHSQCSACWLVWTALGLNAKVLKTLFFAVMKWLLQLVSIIPYGGTFLFPHTILYYLHKPPHIPNPLHPHFSGAIFGKYTFWFMQFNIFSWTWWNSLSMEAVKVCLQ